MSTKNKQSSDEGNTEATGNEKVVRLFRNWIDRKVDLIFHLRSGGILEAVLLYYTRYEYVVDPGNQKPAILIHKHAVDYIE